MSDSQGPEIRAAIVGAGLMGQWHAHALTRAGGRLVAVADCQTDAALRLAEAYRARAFASLNELLTQVPVDVVHICTPSATHVELAAFSLDSGVHLLVEKPLAPDADSTARLLEQARLRNRQIVPVHQFIFQSGVKSALARLSDLSPLVHLEATAVTAGAAKDDEAHDQLAADIVPHVLALFQYLLPGCLDSVEWLARRPAPGELRALGQTQHVSLMINISTSGRPTRNILAIMGQRGSVHIDLFHGFAVFEKGTVSRTQKILRPFHHSMCTFTLAALNLAARAWRNEPAYPGLRELIRASYAAIRDGTPAPISPDEVLSVARARDRLTSASLYSQ